MKATRRLGFFFEMARLAISLRHNCVSKPDLGLSWGRGGGRGGKRRINTSHHLTDPLPKKKKKNEEEMTGRVRGQF